MRRSLIVAIVLAPVVAVADPSGDVSSSADAPASDQSIGAEVGVAAGGSVTPGGLRIAGHYLYQMSSQDWFDGVASFTYGGDTAGCFRDRSSDTMCEHGLTTGSGVEIAATVRRMFQPQGAFQPFAKLGVGVAIARFHADDVIGIGIPLHLGGGVRARVAPAIAIVAQADLSVGIGDYSRDLGAEPLLGMAVTAGAEFDLR
jgi:opacity protein-like surface antigen